LLVEIRIAIQGIDSWSTSLIPATGEAEIGRIVVPGQLGQKVQDSHLTL
jgi:hypothetical protein